MGEQERRKEKWERERKCLDLWIKGVNKFLLYMFFVNVCVCKNLSKIPSSVVAFSNDTQQ